MWKRSKKAALLIAALFLLSGCSLLDTLPGFQEMYGNTPGNIANGGLVAQQGDWVYYSNPDPTDSPTGYHALYKIRTDDTEKTKLDDGWRIDSINVVGDWIYYRQIDKGLRGYLYKIRTDGTEKTKLTDNDDKSIQVESIVVVDEWVYYTRFSGDGLWKIRTDGTDKTQLNLDKSSIFDFNLVDGWIYYFNSHGIFKMDTNAANNTRLNDDDNVNGISVADGWIYFVMRETSGEKMYKMQLDGTHEKKLSDVDVRDFNIVGDWIYYQNRADNYYLYKIHTDGTCKTKLNSSASLNINIVGNWIYYITRNDDIDILCKIRPDGTENQKVD